MTAPKPMPINSHQITGSESLWFMDRCDWCWGEVRSDLAIIVGEKKYCSAKCKTADSEEAAG